MNPEQRTASAPPRTGWTTPRPSLRAAFGGIWQLTYPRYLTPRSLLSTLAAVGALAALAIAMKNDPREFLTFTARPYLNLLIPLIAFAKAGGAMRDELRASTLDYVLTRPIPRPAFVVFNYVAHVAIAQVQFLAASLVLYAIGRAIGVAGLADVALPLLATQVGLIFAATGFGFLCAAITSRYLLLGLAYGVLVEVGIGEFPTALNQLSLTHQMRAAVSPVVSRFIPGFGDATTAAPWTAAAFVVVATTITLVLASAVVRMRELGDGRADG